MASKPEAMPKLCSYWRRYPLASMSSNAQEGTNHFQYSIHKLNKAMVPSWGYFRFDAPGIGGTTHLTLFHLSGFLGIVIVLQ